MNLKSYYYGWLGERIAAGEKLQDYEQFFYDKVTEERVAEAKHDASLSDEMADFGPHVTPKAGEASPPPKFEFPDMDNMVFEVPMYDPNPPKRKPESESNPIFVDAQGNVCTIHDMVCKTTYVFDPIEQSAFIYFLFDDKDQLFYLGKTKYTPVFRLNKHIEDGRQFSRAVAVPVPYALLKYVEGALIRHYRKMAPLTNVREECWEMRHRDAEFIAAFHSGDWDLLLAEFTNECLASDDKGEI